jgi:capsular exopolysaccharide synthesis family protein
MPKKKLTPLNEDFDFKLFVTIARRMFPYFLAFMFTAMLVAYLVLRYTIPVYESRSVIKIAIENTATNLLQTSRDLLADPNNLQLAGHIELIRSSIIAERVVNSIPVKISYYLKGRFLENELYTNSPFEVEMIKTSEAYYGVPFFIRFLSFSEFKLARNEDFNDPQLGNYTFKVDQVISLDDLAFKIKLTRLAAEFEKRDDLLGVNYYFKINNPEAVARTFISNLNVSVYNPEARTIAIRYKDRNAARAADIVNAFATEYIEYDAEKNREATNHILNFIEQTLASVEKDLINSEQEIENFRTSNQVMNPTHTVGMLTGKIWELKNNLLNQQIEAKILEGLKQDIENSKEISSLVMNLIGKYQNGALIEGIKVLQHLINKADEIKLLATTNNHLYQATALQMENQRNYLLSLIKNEEEQLKEKIKNTTKQLKEFEDLFSTMPGKQAEFDRLTRIFSINEKFYSLLLERQTEFSILSAGLITRNVLLEKASVISKPVSPNKTLIISMWLMIGFVSSFVLVTIKYLTYNEITSLEEIGLYTDAILLGIIPKYKKEIPVSQLLIDKNPKSIIAEAFRSIRTNLQFISHTPGSKTICVTSTISGEGKTFTSINLGGVLAFSGKRVVILDLDMRKPKIHLGFNVENSHGVSTILIGRDRPEDCLIKSTLPNLEFITAGPVPPNPSELILNPQMAELIDYLKQHFDVIIMDTPPVGVVSDGIPVLQMVDYPLYILRANFSRKMFIHNINRLINENKIKNLSVILNGVDMQKLKYGYGYGYGYGYTYGYTYGYGYYEDDYTEPTLIEKIRSKLGLRLRHE